MYLSDVDIRTRLTEINFECRYTEHPFNAQEQIGPASVDLRVDNVFWMPKRSQVGLPRSARRRLRASDVVDLRGHDVYEAQPKLHWERKVLNPGETILLKPGEGIMARTYEQFTVPPGLAGKLSARVSYARLGLLIHCGSDFLNPGFRGRQPLQLVNLSGLPIRLAPFFPVAQLSFVQLTSPSEQLYGEGDRYWHDDGGPSKWWQDGVVKRIIGAYGQDNLPRPVSDGVNAVIREGAFTDDQLVRLLDYRGSTQVAGLTSGDDFIDGFAQAESSRARRFSAWTSIGIAATPVLASAFVGSLFTPWSTLHWALFGLLVGAVAVGIGSFIRRSNAPTFFTRSVWDAYKRDRTKSKSTETY